MSLYFTSINSGSNGNCYYVGNDHDAVLIDVGISCREMEKRMLRLKLSMDKVKAIFISHEHSDHIKGLSMISQKYKLPVYISAGTYRNLTCEVDPDLIRKQKSFEEISIGELKIKNFPKIHDAYDPHSFIISCNKIHVGVFTDFGRVCKNLITHFKKCHAAFLETNYDEDLLEAGKYPWFLKNRIRGGNGHLSNREALDLFRTHKPLHMSHLFLSHLSKDNNCEELVSNLFQEFADGTKIIVAGRYNETEVYFIKSSVSKRNKVRSLISETHQTQLSLF